MTDREMIAELLSLVNVRKGDGWWDPCCASCYDDRWHREGRYGGPGVVTGDAIWKTAVPKCTCVCHAARKMLGLEDVINDPRWEALPDGT